MSENEVVAGAAEAVAEQDGTGEIKATSPELRSIGWRWPFFKIVFSLYIVSAIALMASSVHAANVVQAVFESDTANQPSYETLVFVDTHQSLTSIALLASLIGSIIAFGFLMPRSMHNAREWAGGQTDYQPPSLVWWFFIPIMNLFKPYMALQELWGILHQKADEEEQSDTVLFPLWWGAWIIGGIMGNIAFRLPGNDWSFELSGGNYDDYVFSRLYDVPELLFNIISAIALLALASRIVNLQRKLGLGNATGS